jgi:hypothetical protein
MLQPPSLTQIFSPALCSQWPFVKISCMFPVVPSPRSYAKFNNISYFFGQLYPIRPPPSWRTTPCRLFTATSRYKLHFSSLVFTWRIWGGGDTSFLLGEGENLSLSVEKGFPFRNVRYSYASAAPSHTVCFAGSPFERKDRAELRSCLSCAPTKPSAKLNYFWQGFTGHLGARNLSRILPIYDVLRGIKTIVSFPLLHFVSNFMDPLSLICKPTWQWLCS